MFRSTRVASLPKEKPTIRSVGQQTTHWVVMTQLLAVEREAKRFSFNQAWTQPLLFERLLDRHGLAYFYPDLWEASSEARVTALEKIISAAPFLEKIINKSQDLDFLLRHPDLVAFISPLLSRVLDKPNQLRKIIKELGLIKLDTLIKWNERGLEEPRLVAKILEQVGSDEALSEQFVHLLRLKNLEGPEAQVIKAAEEFQAILSRQLPARPGWLEGAFSGFLGGHFGNSLTQTVAAVFLKQPPEQQLAILLSLKRTPQPRGAMKEDSITYEPVKAAEAVYLKVDLPLVVNSDPEIYNRATLARLPSEISPFSRKKFTENDLQPLLGWLNASAEERFVLLVRNRLTAEENEWVSAQDILALVQLPLLINYLKNNKPLYDLVKRLNKLYPWGDEQAPSQIKEWRARLVESYFPSGKDLLVSVAELSLELTKLEKVAEQPVEEPKDEESYFLYCLTCCLGGGR